MSNRKLKKSKSKLLVLFILCILSIILAFIFLSCGKGPQFKVRNPEAGQYAVDFSANLPGTGVVSHVSLGQSIDNLDPDDPNNPDTNFTGEFTIEAWVKSMAQNITGGIFSRGYDHSAIILYVEDSKPAFAMKKINYFSSPIIVSDPNSVIPVLPYTDSDDDWTHIAVVLAKEDHSTGPNAHTACAGDVGSYSSIALDSLDNIHISYYTSSSFNLKYATNSTGSWVNTILDGIGNGEYSSIDTDSLNNPHISYYDLENKDLKHTTNATGSWVITTVDSSTDAGTFTSIFIDSSDKAHISYYAASNVIMKYANNTDGPWCWSGPTQPWPNSGGDTSIAVDSINSIHISYYYTADKDLLYSTGLYTDRCLGFMWDPQTLIDSTGDVGQYSSLAIDSSNNSHISYYDATNGYLKYATNASGSWVTSIVDSTGDVGQYTSIAIDLANKAHISYYDVDNGELQYADFVGGGGGAGCTNADWNCTTVDDGTTGGGNDDVGRYTSIDMDTSNNAHISYYDATNGDLKYANFVGSGSGNCTDPDWNCETVDNGSARTESPHIDIYVNGVFRHCASTGENFSDSIDERLLGTAMGKLNEQLGRSLISLNNVPAKPSTKLNAVVDEVRFWKVARTKSELQQCMNQELSIEGGTCGIDDGTIGYWKFNEGSGINITDHSGSGNGGTKGYCDDSCSTENATSLDWDGGWVTGYPFP